jgi:energy-coupling factor transporter transmembrane protein EcfT
MSVDTQTEKRDDQEPKTAEQPAGRRATPGSILGRIVGSFRNVEWSVTLLTALVMAVVWVILFLANNFLQILAGVVPVLAGLFLGRRVKGDFLSHGIVLGLSGFLFGLVVIFIYGGLGQAGIIPLPVLQLSPEGPPTQAAAGDLIFIYLTFSLFALIPFPAFGTVMSGRAEQRNRQMRQEVAERGGKLERPGSVRTLEDLQGLSLPQFGSYVANLYRKKGFEFQDYRFVDKDKHLDLYLSYRDETYLLRLSVADKVRPGTIESLVQDVRRHEIPKALAVTSTEFTPDARKAAANRRNLLIIDGSTLFEMAEH